MPNTSKYFFFSAIIAAIFAISTSSILIRFAQSDGVSSIAISALRLIFATVIITPLVLTRHLEDIKRLTRREIFLAVSSGIFFALHLAAWTSSLEYTSVTSSVVFVTTGPLWVALLSPFLLKENLSRVAIIGLCIAFSGGIIVALSDACAWDNGFSCPSLENILQGSAMWGNFLALIGAWTVTGYLIIGRKLRAGLSLLPYIFLVYGMAAIVLLIIAFFSGIPLLGFELKSYGWILLLALVPQLIGHSTFNWALRFLPATLVAVVTLGEPIGSAILAFFFLDENPPLPVYLGGIFILFGIYLTIRKNIKK